MNLIKLNFTLLLVLTNIGALLAAPETTQTITWTPIGVQVQIPKTWAEITGAAFQKQFVEASVAAGKSSKIMSSLPVYAYQDPQSRLVMLVSTIEVKKKVQNPRAYLGELFVKQLEKLGHVETDNVIVNKMKLALYRVNNEKLVTIKALFVAKAGQLVQIDFLMPSAAIYNEQRDVIQALIKTLQLH